MRITVVYFVNVTCTYSSILVNGYLLYPVILILVFSIFVMYITKISVSLHSD